MSRAATVPAIRDSDNSFPVPPFIVEHAGIGMLTIKTSMPDREITFYVEDLIAAANYARGTTPNPGENRD